MFDLKAGLLFIQQSELIIFSFETRNHLSDHHNNNYLLSAIIMLAIYKVCIALRNYFLLNNINKLLQLKTRSSIFCFRNMVLYSEICALITLYNISTDSSS